jgi:ribonuclease P protein component
VKFPKAARLRRRRDFLQVQQRGRRLYSGDVLVVAREPGGPRPRIGITVSSKVGNAVERNQVKRWVREAWRSLGTDLPAADLVVIARPAARTMGFDGARKALLAARQALAPGGRR